VRWQCGGANGNACVHNTRRRCASTEPFTPATGIAGRLAIAGRGLVGSDGSAVANRGGR
jgi:hypothetical protein